MSGKKGMKHYPQEMKKIRQEYKAGASIRGLQSKYGISRWSIGCWCGLSDKVNMRQAAPMPKGRPRKCSETSVQIIKRLEMENELLRNFLSAVGRR